MPLESFLRSQFGKPSGLFGSWILGPLMNVANTRLIARTIELLEPRSRSAILDIGFGGGDSLIALAERAPHSRIWGVDYSPDMVEAAAARVRYRSLQRRVRVQCATVAKLPFPARAFDCILTVNSVYYWPNIVKCLRETRRVLKPGGRLAAGFRSRESLLPFTRGWENFKLYNAQQFARLMRRAGFDVLQVEHRDQSRLQDSVIVVGERRK